MKYLPIIALVLFAACNEPSQESEYDYDKEKQEFDEWKAQNDILRRLDVEMIDRKKVGQQVRLIVQVSNKADKVVNSISGSMSFYDQMESLVFSPEILIEKEILPDTFVTDTFFYKYSAYSTIASNHGRFLNADSLTEFWSADKVVFSDGSRLGF